MMKQVYLGIDYANHSKRTGCCWVLDDGLALHAGVGEPPIPPRRIAVDSPLGLPIGFTEVLAGRRPADPGRDEFKSRSSERVVRAHVGQYSTVADWKAYQNRKQVPAKLAYYRPTAHIQSAVGMAIIPGAVRWAIDTVARGENADNRLRAIVAARRGDGLIVEAHPRPYLYSALERIRAHRGEALSVQELTAAVRYKDSKQKLEERKQNRLKLILLLGSDRHWQGAQLGRRLEFQDAVREEIVKSDHSFDAWLSALTAWSHEQGETWTWAAAQLDATTVESEGHMLILSPDSLPERPR